MMEAPSSDGLEILSTNSYPPRSTRPPQTTAGSSAAFADIERRALAASSPPSRRSATLSNVIELSDGSEDETTVRGGRGGGEDSDGDLQVLAGPSKPAQRNRLDPSSATSDDLPSASAVWASLGTRNGGHVMRRSSSMLIGTSASAGLTTAPLARAKTLPLVNEFDDLPSSAFSVPSHFTSSPAMPPPPPPPPPPAAAKPPDPEGKGRRRLVFDDDDQHGAEEGAAADLWGDILGEPSPGKGKGKGKAKGKKKDDEETVAKEKGKGKKRLFNDASDGECGPAAAKRVAKPPRPSKSPDKSSKLISAGAAPTLSKTALKKQETAERVRLREANTLRAGDKKVSTAEMTVHISGTAFDPSDEEGSDDDDMYGPSARNSKKKGKKKASPWVEISSELRERLKLYDCDVECPEVPKSRLGCEGTLRWTRVCDRMWHEETRMFLPLEGGERIVAEEDTRLIFLTAMDLSHHIANKTLSSHITSLQTRLPPHVNLFILLYGLQSLFRDMERARQEAYRIQVRAAGGDGDAAAQAKVKPAGIGESQPGKEVLELEIMRMQVKSKCMIVSVDKVSEAVDWLEQITFDVGQKPYQRHKHSHVALLGTSEDKVESGKDLQDTYLKMLASLPRVTDGIAKGIAGEYPTLRELYEAWDRCVGDKAKREMLVGIGKGRNVNGTATHRVIGKTLSASLYEILTGRNPALFL
ncbi:hypothetical protein JCM11641_005421 [Rhodosporidiobolus odoratus]